MVVVVLTFFALLCLPAYAPCTKELAHQVKKARADLGKSAKVCEKHLARACDEAKLEGASRTRLAMRQ